MTEREFQHIKYFKPSDFDDKHQPPGTCAKMDSRIVYFIDGLREAMGLPIIITPNGGFASNGHSSNSMHYRGMATDFFIVTSQPMSAYRTAANIIRLNPLIKGIGFYFFWHDGAGKQTVGYHTDCRPGPLAMWRGDYTNGKCKMTYLVP